MKCDSNYEMKKKWKNFDPVDIVIIPNEFILAELWVLVLWMDIYEWYLLLKTSTFGRYYKAAVETTEEIFFKILSIFCWCTLSPTLLCPWREWGEEESRREEEGIGHERRKWSISAEITSAQLWWHSGKAPHGWWHLPASFRLKHHQL